MAIFNSARQKLMRLKEGDGIVGTPVMNKPVVRAPMTSLPVKKTPVAPPASPEYKSDMQAMAKRKMMAFPF